MTLGKGLCWIIFASAVTLMSGEALGASADQKAIFSAQIEEDWFAGTDRYYTTGIRLAITWEDVAAPKFANQVETALRWLSPLPQDNVSRPSITIGLATQFYTPDKTSSSGLGPTDRPYAGWLFLDGIERHLRLDGIRNIVGEDYVELQAGIVGPHAFSGDIQTWFHKRIHSPVFEGWHNQLHDEPGIMLLVERRWRKALSSENSNIGIDIWPRLGGSLGNVRTQLHGGVIMRAGYNLPKSLPIGQIVETAVAPPENWSIYVLAGFETRAVAHNIFLDGNTFDRHAHVRKRYIVNDTYASFSVQRGAFSVSYTYVVRGKEFFGQTSPQRYGVVFLGFGIPI